MPTYGYACPACGPFERRVDHEEAGQPQGCPGCGEPGLRAYAAPHVRSPAGPFASASNALRSRLERAHTGEPVVSQGPPPGREMAALRHGHGGHAHGLRQPWAIGH